MAGSTDDSDYMSSDEELQEEFTQGRLQPGLIVRNRPQKECVNDLTGLKEQLSKLRRKNLAWLERMEITSARNTTITQTVDESSVAQQEMDKVDAEDDFKREMHFFHQAQSSVRAGLQKLEELGVPYLRPEDFFAEMIKTDDHMKKVRQSLLGRQKILEQKEKARKQRELKKYGKKVQQEILQKRRSEKKAMAASLTRYKKGKGDRVSTLKETEDSFPVSTNKDDKERGPMVKGKRTAKKSGLPEKSKKRKLKDQMFGFGGKKKRFKSNTAQSTADMSSFDSSKHSRSFSKSHKAKSARGKGRKGEGKKSTGGRGGKKKPIRLGKSRRNKKK